MRVSAHGPCVCGSGKKGRACCLPVLEGAPAATPEALMRSRYAAYATGKVGHLMRTTHPDSPHAQPDARAWARGLTAWCASLRCLGLTVLEAGLDGDVGWVHFHANLRSDGRDVSFGERSRFLRVDGRWTYVDGEITDRR